MIRLSLYTRERERERERESRVVLEIFLDFIF
jgi:hypothetical protein